MRNARGSIVLIGAVSLALVVIIGLYGVLTYNSLVTKEEQTVSAWAQVENQLQRRFDLIPNLVETVKGYADYEEALFTALAEARTQYANADTLPETAAANDALSTALSRLLVVVENYPDLKANEQFIRLTDELAGTENRLAVARMDFNDAVQAYNNRVRKAPSNVIASLFQFEQKAYFTIEDGVAETPTVDFGGGSS